MRALFLVPVLALALTGCNLIARENGDYFQAGADIGAFEADTQACTSQASDHVSYDLSAMDGTYYERHRAYNAAFGRCMRDHGHAPRPYARNWLPAG